MVISIAQARSEMETQITNFIQCGNQGKVLYLKVPAGVGKSHTTTQVINTLFPNRSREIAWYGSMHDQFDDLGHLRKDWEHIFGRNDGNNAGRCIHDAEAKLLATRGISVKDELCVNCKSKCSYWHQLEKPGHKFLPHQMLFYYEIPKAEVLIFDELNVQVFLEKQEIDANEITLQGIASPTSRLFWLELGKLLMLDAELCGEALYEELRKAFDVHDNPSLRQKIADTDFKQVTQTKGQIATQIAHGTIGKLFQATMLSELDRIINGQDFNPSDAPPVISIAEM